MNAEIQHAVPPLPLPLGVGEGPIWGRDKLLASAYDQLLAPFPEAEIDWLLREEDVSLDSEGKPRGRVFPYVKARAIQERFDAVFGIYWSSRMVPAPFSGRSGMVCEISVLLPDGRTITKSDAADLTSFEAVKGGSSNAFKRAAVQFGVGRYLYKVGESQARFHAGGRFSVRCAGQHWRWDPPLLPGFALPEADREGRDALLAAIRAREEEEQKLKREEAEAKRRAEQDARAKALAEEMAKARNGAAAKPGNSAPGGAAKQEAPPRLPQDVTERLAKALGGATPFIISYLKARRYLGAKATSLAEMSPEDARALLANPTVPEKAGLLHSVNELVAGRDAAATSYFASRGAVRPGQPWFLASEGFLRGAVADAAQLDSALTRLAAATGAAA